MSNQINQTNAGTKPEEKLAAEFPASTHEGWKVAAEALLKGAPFDKIMLTATPENITLQPIYERNVLENLPAAKSLPGQSSYLRGTRPEGYRSNPWDVAQEIHASNPAAFNADLIHDLEAGLNAVSVDLTGPNALRLETAKDAIEAFNKVIPDALSWHFHAGERAPDTLRLFYAWLIAHNAKTDKVNGSLNYDPLGTLAATGHLSNPLNRTPKKEGVYDKLALTLKFAAANLPNLTTVGVNTRAYHNAGASAVEELGIAIATGVEYLRALTARDIDISTAAAKTAFHFAIGGNFFVELAKLRAARVLWERIVRELGGDAQSAAMHQHARTGLFNKTRHDPCVNILRTTTEALGGVLAGVESLTVGTFDEVVQEPDEFSRRIARNTQIILREECELTAVIDPAGGSWYIEQLTDDIARKAWEFFQKIEEKGGAAAALQSGFIQETIAATRKGREKLLGQRRLSLVGTNQYPNISEKPLTGKPLPAATTQTAPAAAAVSAPALNCARLATPYETLRAAAIAYTKTHGHGPKIHLANIAALRRHKARADFTRGFFETGGFEIAGSEGGTDDAVIAEKAIASGAQIVVICGHDEDYPAHVPAIASAIKAKNANITVLLAGNPGDNEAAFKAAGLDSFIFVKSDNFATNRQYLQKLGAIA